MLKSFIKNEDGSMTVIGAVFFVILVGFAALSFDAVLLNYEQERLQAAADSAALSGAYALKEPDTMEAIAVQFANLNQNMITVTGTDIALGQWDYATRTFTVGGTLVKAIRVTISAIRPAYFARLFGFDNVPISVSSVATFDEAINTCFLRGAKAGRDVHVGLNVTISGKSCVYGGRFSHYGNGLTVDKDSVIAATDKNDINLGLDTILDGRMISANIDMDFNALDMISDLEDGNFPPNIYRVEHIANEADLPATLDSGTAYIIDGDLHIEKNYAAHDVILAVKGQVHWNDGGELTNTVDVCGDPEFGIVGIIATKDIHINKDAKASGVTMYTDTSIHVNNALTSFGGNMNAAKDVRINQSANFGGCKSGDPFREDEIAAVVTRLVQ